MKLLQKIKEGSDFFFINERLERRECPWHFCKYCDHNETGHQSETCFRCREAKEKGEGKFISNHKFNEKPSVVIEELAQILKYANFQDDKYYMSVLMKKANLLILTEIEKRFGWKLNEISVSAHNKEYLWIVFYKTTIFCRYCGSPQLTMQDKMKHEQAGGLWSCYKKPAEVTFAG